ncbi:MAG: threonine ammonia-lyase [Syntrophobacteraceae bacterium]
MISLDDIKQAASRLDGRILRTPLIFSPSFSKMTGAEVYLKLENLQETGSFKLRGATNKIQAMLPRLGGAGVVAASAGNHAQGVALAARRAGLQSTIVMPEWASITKQQATAGYGGQVVLEGLSIGDCIRKAQSLAAEGMHFIHPYDDPDIMAGQGTIGIEILEELADVAMIVVPIGGGGLIAGVATAVKALRPETEIVGVQAAACPSAIRALESGHSVWVEGDRSLADGITVKQVGELPFAVIRRLVDHVALVEEDEIATAILTLLERKRILAEGAGAVAMAALMHGLRDRAAGKKVVLLVSGGNVDSPLLDRIIRQGLFRSGRYMRFGVTLPDTPGSLHRMLGTVAALKANVLHIHHDRSGGHLPIHLTRVMLEVETRGHDHIRDLLETLKQAGYEAQPR